MRERRRRHDGRLLWAGPGRLCEALAIGRELDGARLDRRPFSLVAGNDAGWVVAEGVRIGISKSRQLPRWFALAGSRFLSKPMAAATKTC